MANIKSSKKRARQMVVRRQKNLARKTALKTAVKKVMEALKSEDYTASVSLLRDMEAQMSRAKSKKLLHANTASRKVGRIAKKVAALGKRQSTVSAA